MQATLLIFCVGADREALDSRLYCEPLRPVHRDCNTFATPTDSSYEIIESLNEQYMVIPPPDFTVKFALPNFW